jgi:outer membrane protein OmpA-like peptidoglycan-associated protein
MLKMRCISKINFLFILGFAFLVLLPPELQAAQSAYDNMGMFLPNIIRSAAAAESADIYDRLKQYGKERRHNGGIWGQEIGGMTELGKDDEYGKKYIDLYNGYMVGYDRLLTKKAIFGIYGKYKENKPKQGEHKADIGNMGAGIYYGFVGDTLELKTFVSAMKDKYAVSLYVDDSNDGISKPEFDLNTFSADAEISLKSATSKGAVFRTYLGMEANYVQYKNFAVPIPSTVSEDLEIAAGDYSRQAARVGLEMKYDNNRNFIIYGSVEGKYLLLGHDSKITAELAGSQDKFIFEGFNEKDEVIGGAGAGIAFNITKGLRLFINMKYFGGKYYQSAIGNAGFRYSFGNGNEDEDSSYDLKAANSEKEAVPALKLEEKKQEPPVEKQAVEKVMLLDKVQEVQEDKKKAEIELKNEELPKDYKDYTVDGNFKNYLSDSKSEYANPKNYFTAAEAEYANSSMRGKKHYTSAGSSVLTILFYGDNPLNKGYEREIQSLLKLLNNNYNRISIEGHADSTGNESSNEQLSLARARLVAAAFVRFGVPREKLDVKFFGSSVPAESNKTQAGRAKNRRVEIKIY